MATVTWQEQRAERAAANARLGTIFFLVVEIVFFVGILAAAASIRFRFATWPPAGAAAPDTALLLANAGVLFASGLAAWRGLLALRRDAADRAVAWLGATLALGAIFLGLQLLELSRLAASPQLQTMLRDLFGTVSWLHGLHVAAGLMLLALVAARTRRGACRRDREALFLASVLFWLLVVLTWPLLLAVLIIPA